MFMKERLGNYIQEYSVRNKNGEDIPVYSVTNTQGFCKDYFGKEVASKDKTTYKIVPRGCFAYNPSRINVGSVDYQRYEDKVIVSPLYNVFTVSDNLDKQYLYYYLKSGVALQRIRNVASGSVRDNLKLSMLYEFPINVRDIEEQRSIVYKLDQIRNIIDLRQQELEQLDELVKARFVELFGDMAHSNNKICLEEISDFVTVGIANSATHAYADSGVAMLRNQNIKENYLDENDLIYITPDFAQKYGSKQLAENDILVIRTGYPGVACLVPKKYEGCQTFTTLIVRLKDSTLAHANYVCHYINSSFGKDYVEQSKVGVAQQNFGAKALAKMPIAVPPVELQKQFATFVEQTDKSKFVGAICIDKIQSIKGELL